MIAMLLLPAALAGVDRDFLRQFERLQRERPANLTSGGTVAPPTEPGIPMRLEGRLVTGSGRAAIRDAVVFAWQTDASGLYDRPGSAPHSWRLHGWARTDREGRFSFTTIRPAAYPSRTEPAHVHFTVERSNGSRYFVPSLMFDGDPLLTPSVLAQRDAVVASVERRGGAQYVSFTLQLEEDGRF